MTPLLLSAAAVWLSAAGPAAPPPERHAARGLVLEVDAPGRRVVVSHDDIPGFMDAMAMPFSVRKSEDVATLAAGHLIDFVVVEEKDAIYAEGIRVRAFTGTDPQAMKAQQLEILQSLMADPADPAVAVGAAVPDFSLVDHNKKTVTLSRLQGQVVVVSFMYTRCRLANACFRLSNNLAILRDRFGAALGKDLALLTVTFDPANDGPEALQRYAKTWRAEAPDTGWHFLTGPVEEVRRVCHLFGMNFWADLGMITHTMRTIVIDRNGTMIARLEGNEFTAQQLGDLVDSVLKRSPGRNTSAE
jgi:protein SCO1/2